MSPTTAADDHRAGLPDLVVEAFYNYTPVVVGGGNYFNLTIKNQGDGAYLVKTVELEIYCYRDSETQVAFFQRVYDNIYPNDSLILDIELEFDTTGTHTLTVVLDERNSVAELDETNNEATVEFEVVPNPENRPPHADGGNDRTNHVGQSMLFSASESSDPDHDELSFWWDFGDGTTGMGMRTYHMYLELGDYGATLTVSDGHFTDTDSFTVHIVEAPTNTPPTATISVASQEVNAGEDLSLDGSDSADPDPIDELVYDWDLDDSDGIDDWIRGPIVVANWEATGTYLVTLRVSDGKASSEANVIITVTAPETPNIKPTAMAGPDSDAVKGDWFGIQGAGQDPDGSIVLYEWDLDGDGQYDTYSTTAGMLEHRFDTSGMYTLWLKVTDDDGAVGTDSVVVTVVESKGGDKDGAPGPGALLAVIAITLVALLVRGRPE